MQTLESIKKDNAPLQAAKLEEEAFTKGTSEDKVFSKVTTSPFRHQEAGDKPRMSFLPSMANRVSGCQNPLTAPFQNAKTDILHDERQKYRDSLMYSVPYLTRKVAINVLVTLIECDECISPDDSLKLCEAVNVINRANLTTPPVPLYFL